MDFYVIMRWAQNSVMIFDFIVAFFVVVNFRGGVRSKILFIYTFCAALLSVFSIFKMEIGLDTYNEIYISSIYAHFLILSSMICIIKKPMIGKWILPIAYVWFVLSILSYFLFFYNEIEVFQGLVNIGLLLLSIYYYYRLFGMKESFRIFNDFSFYAVTGVFCGMILALPITVFSFFFKNSKAISHATYLGIFSAGALGYILMHLFFIKAFLCLKVQKTR